MAQGLYVNMAMLNHNETEFVIDFIYVQPQVPKATVRARVINSPKHMKRLLAALQENVAKYEAQFGKIDVTGPPETLGAILDMLTDPKRPTALGSTSWKQVARKEGLVKGEFKLYSIRVRPAASLGLEKEEG